MFYSADILREAKLLRRRRRRRRAAFGLIIVLVFLAGLIWLAREPRFSIQRVVVAGERALPEKEIVAAAESVLTGDYLWLIPRRLFLIYPKARLLDKLRGRFPELLAVAAELDGPTDLQIKVTERKPEFLWCSNESPASSDAITTTADCYFVDQTGVVFSPAPWFSPNTFFKLIGGALATTTAPLGEPVLANDNFQALLAVRRNLTISLASQQIGDLTLARLLPDNDVEWQVTSPLKPTWRLLANLRHDPVIVANNLAAALASPDFLKLWSASQAVLDYLDLRFGNKVFYKFKD